MLNTNILVIQYHEFTELEWLAFLNDLIIYKLYIAFKR